MGNITDETMYRFFAVFMFQCFHDHLYGLVYINDRHIDFTCDRFETA